MGYRQIYIKQANHLSNKHESLIIHRDENDIEIPLEDIASILLEDHKTTITASLLAALSNNYITLITCDKQYIPSSMVIPMNMHYRQLKVLKMQLDVKKPLISQLWALIVKSKIENQILALQLCKRSSDAVDYMKVQVKDIHSGDKTNREAVCAKAFFSAMYGNTFVRSHNSQDHINAALNYGYSILASNFTRLFSMYGFQTMIGLHHCSQTNSFNLSYDFVEVFRAIVDVYVFQHQDTLGNPLFKETRVDLIDLLQESVIFDNKYYSVQNAMEEMILSFIKCLENDSSEFLKLPSLMVRDYEADQSDEL